MNRSKAGYRGLCRAAGLAVLVGVNLQAFAQTPPDAGGLLQQQRATQPREPRREAPPPEIQPEPLPALRLPEGQRIKVSAFKVADDAGGLFPEETLRILLSSYVGRELTLADLQRAAEIVGKYYRDRGYFLARGYLPKQEIENGVVVIRVIVGRIEGRPGGEDFSIRGASVRLERETIQRTVASAVRPGEPAKLENLERGLLLLNDLSGVSARANLSPGAASGAAKLDVAVEEGPLIVGSVGADNYGNRYTGRNRITASVGLNDYMAAGDNLGLSAARSDGDFSYGRLHYQRPVGYDGFKAGVVYSHLNYELGEDFASLKAKGKSDTLSPFGSYPFARTRAFNSFGGFSLDYKKLFNEAAGVTTSDKRITALTLSLNNDLLDDFLGGGLNTAGISLTGGRLDLGGWAPDLANDQQTARTDGSYAKTNINVARNQRLPGSFSLYVAISSQWASKNLDSSEKLVLGGPTAVRAYPSGEASGDEGYLANIELRWNTGGDFQVFGFYDTGRITQHKEPWSGWKGGNPNARNGYSLSGAGLGANLAKTGRYDVRIAYARKIGDNPGRSAAKLDSDGTNDKDRWWVQATARF